MPAATAVANGTAPNGHPGGVKSSAVKSRGALKRLKAKAKAKRNASEAPTETPSEAEHSDAEVSYGMDEKLTAVHNIDSINDDGRVVP